MPNLADSVIGFKKWSSPVFYNANKIVYLAVFINFNEQINVLGFYFGKSIILLTVPDREFHIHTLLSIPPVAI